ncbi:MAG: SLC13 family permease, partial [Anaerolinea sp.]|nr:SLC13 family permease [Anaerolinea sp.]
MTLEMWVTLAILLVALLLFITELIRLDLVALGVMVALMLTGILTVEEGLAGFSNKAVISIAALFIVGGAVFQTGLASMIAARILQIAGGSQVRLIVILMVSIALMSAFISSTGVVALMLPAVVSLSRSLRINPSKLLIPMAYSALLGGGLTIIGTPPNLLVSEALSKAGLPAFDFFSFTPIGLIVLGVGVVYMALIGRRWLPDRKAEGGVQTVITPQELFRIYELPGNLYRVRVQDDSPLIGKSIGASGLRSEFDLNVVTIYRTSGTSNAILSILNRNGTDSNFRVPTPETCLQANDVVLLQGEANDLSRATGALKLA